jgi:hypothetical protein
VYLNQRIHVHNIFTGLVGRRNSYTGWFFGFKLLLVVNNRGKLLNIFITSGNVDDCKPVPRLAKRLFSKLFGDKGYISQPLADSLLRSSLSN